MFMLAMPPPVCKHPSSLDALGYCCTSASAVLGEAAVFGQLSLASPGALLTTPATAAAAAFRYHVVGYSVGLHGMALTDSLGSWVA